MDNFVSKTFVACSTEKSFDNFYNKYRECKQCNNEKGLKRYYDNKDGILQKRRDTYARSKDMYIRLKELEEKFSGKIDVFCKRSHLKQNYPTNRIRCLSF